MQYGQGIIENLPMLMETAGTILENVGKTLDEHMDTILDNGIEIIISILDGISRKMPDLVPKAIEVLGKFADTLISHSSELTNVGMKLIIALGKGLIQALPELIFQVINIKSTVRKEFAELISSAPQWRTRYDTWFWRRNNGCVRKFTS